MIYVLAIPLYLWALWYAYILVMGLYRAHLAGRLTRFTYFLAIPALLIGYAMDVLANITIASAMFAELPRVRIEMRVVSRLGLSMKVPAIDVEWLVTDRLKRYIASEAGWRADLATLVCTHLLDYFDPTGEHC